MITRAELAAFKTSPQAIVRDLSVAIDAADALREALRTARFTLDAIPAMFPVVRDSEARKRAIQIADAALAPYDALVERKP